MTTRESMATGDSAGVLEDGVARRRVRRDDKGGAAGPTEHVRELW